MPMTLSCLNAAVRRGASGSCYIRSVSQWFSGISKLFASDMTVIRCILYLHEKSILVLIKASQKYSLAYSLFWVVPVFLSPSIQWKRELPQRIIAPFWSSAAPSHSLSSQYSNELAETHQALFWFVCVPYSSALLRCFNTIEQWQFLS